MITYFNALEADFARYYQIDLPAAVWGPEPISGRRFRSLITALPADGAFGREVSPPQQWGNVEELLATTIEVIDFGNRILHEAYCAKPHPDPIQIIRPGTEPERRNATPDELRAFLDRTGRN